MAKKLRQEKYKWHVIHTDMQEVLEIAEQDRQRVMNEINVPSVPGKDFKAAAEFYRSFKYSR